MQKLLRHIGCRTNIGNQNPYIGVCGESARPPAWSYATLQGLDVRIPFCAPSAQEGFCMSLVTLGALPHRAVCDRPQRISRPAMRHQLWEVSPHCRYCGRKIARKKARLDHIWPLSRGGADHVGNLALCCHDCNTAKQNKTPTELLWWSIRIAVTAFVALMRDTRGGCG